LLISFNIVFKVHGLLISLSTFNWRHSPKSLSSAETDLAESTTVQQLWACVTTKKLLLDSHTVLHPLWPVVVEVQCYIAILLA
jgi:hypothetical protein